MDRGEGRKKSRREEEAIGTGWSAGAVSVRNRGCVGRSNVLAGGPGKAKKDKLP